jgi:hypothetical protein
MEGEMERRGGEDDRPERFPRSSTLFLEAPVIALCLQLVALAEDLWQDRVIAQQQQRQRTIRQVGVMVGQMNS